MLHEFGQVFDNLTSSAVLGQVFDNLSSSAVFGQVFDNLTSLAVFGQVFDNLTSSAVFGQVFGSLTSSAVFGQVFDNLTRLPALVQVFEKYLLDADWSVCAGNWMWVSSSAFEKVLQCPRCICPVRYGRRMDPKGNYVRWVACQEINLASHLFILVCV